MVPNSVYVVLWLLALFRDSRQSYPDDSVARSGSPLSMHVSPLQSIFFPPVDFSQAVLSWVWFLAVLISVATSCIITCTPWVKGNGKCNRSDGVFSPLFGVLCPAMSSIPLLILRLFTSFRYLPLGQIKGTFLIYQNSFTCQRNPIMIRLPPTSIQLSESDVHYHLQRVMLRHALVADLEKLELDYSYEDEDGKRHLGSPISLQESCSSSVVLDSGSDIIAEAASIRGRPYIDCRYKSSHQEGTPQPEAGSSSSIPQLDGASFIANSDLNVENVSDAMLASPHHGYSRLYSIDQTPMTHFRALMRGRGAAGRKGYGSCASEQLNSSPDPSVPFSPVDTDHLPLFDPAVGSLDLERPCSFKIRRKSQRLTNMCSKYMLDFQVSQNKQGASLMQLPPRTPLYHHAVARKGSMLRFAQSASFDSSDITSVCEEDVRGSPTEGVKNGCGTFVAHKYSDCEFADEIAQTMCVMFIEKSTNR